jgi:16S rRNA processing protein RimM
MTAPTKLPGVTVALAVRAHGVRGELACDILTDFPDRLTKLKSVALWDGKQPPRHFAVKKCWLSHSHGGQAIFQLEGIGDMDAAKKLVGLEVQIPFDARAPLSKDSHYISDLVGCSVVETNGATLGTVTDVQINGDAVSGTPVLAVKSSSGEILIPLAQDICVSIDTAARRIEVVLPDGLLDINRA